MSGRDRAGRSPLHYAAADGDAPRVEELIEQGFDVNEPDANGFTPLHFAAQAHALDATGILLDHGANIYAVNRFGNPPILVAMSTARGRTEEIKLLRDKGADINLKNNYGTSAIDLVRKIGNFDYSGLFP
jgi:uncharacterized protein